MVWVNNTYLDNATGLSEVVGGVNNASGGWLIGGFLITLFIIILIVYYGRVSFGEILIGSGYLLSVLALIFIIMGFLPAFAIGITLSLVVFGLLALFLG